MGTSDDDTAIRKLASLRTAGLWLIPVQLLGVVLQAVLGLYVPPLHWLIRLAVTAYSLYVVGELARITGRSRLLAGLAIIPLLSWIALLIVIPRASAILRENAPHPSNTARTATPAPKQATPSGTRPQTIEPTDVFDDRAFDACMRSGRAPLQHQNWGYFSQGNKRIFPASAHHHIAASALPITTPAASDPPGPDPAHRLRTLKVLRDEGLISQEDYDTRKQEILREI
jgi:hypothetical protein